MEIKGSIEDIRFRNEDNGYTIATLDVEGEPVTCVGTFPPVSEGEFVTAQGDFIMHQKFGRQFKAQRVFSAAPDSEDSIIRYLGSGLIHGVGPKTALAIVSKFGNSALETMEFNPQRLSAIRGISKQKALSIGEEYSKIKKMRDAVMYLQSKSISTTLSLKIFKKYGDDTVAIVKTNPYRLIEDIDGVGFITADKIALEAGIARDSVFRISAGVIYTLMQGAERGGNTYLPKDKLTLQVAQLLGIDSVLVEDIYTQLIISSKIKTVQTPDCESGIMLAQFFRAEKTAAAKLIELIEQSNRIPCECADIIEDFERAEGKVLHETQKKAVRLAVNNGAAVITGGPGTGKTLITKCILRVLDSVKLTYMLTAPTGRAAKRMFESTGVEASTIHRALMSADCAGGGSLNCDVLIVDEFSMVDIFLFGMLLKAMREGTKLILIGDCDQLPSVGAGNVLKDIIESGFVPVVKLTEVYRQSEESLITLNAHAINQGIMPKLDSKDGDFFFMKESDAEKIPTLIASLVSSRLPAYLGSDSGRIQVLCPVKNGAAGTHNLNSVLQKTLNPHSGAEVFEEGQRLSEGDRVMHTANNYSLKWTKLTGAGAEDGEGVFNGDMGYIQKIYPQSGEIEVLFEDNRMALYTPDLRNQLILAYAVTVHKSQGSEFDAVVMPVTGGNNMIFTRNLLYTAITRAKRIVVLVGEEYNIKRMVENNYVAKRFSLLKHLILEAKQKYNLLYGDNINKL